MAKKKTTKKAEKAPIENKAEKVIPATKEAKYNGSVNRGGEIVRMSEAKARLLLKRGLAKFV
jgi:hypothetical protein